jgi:hypothetical protein
MYAFFLALWEGANGIETDIRHTKDNRLVLFHDATMRRINGIDMPVEDLTLEELRALDFGAYMGERFRAREDRSSRGFPRVTSAARICTLPSSSREDGVEEGTVALLYRLWRCRPEHRDELSPRIPAKGPQL